MGSLNNSSKPQLGVIYKFGDFKMVKPESHKRYLEFLDHLTDLIRGSKNKLDSQILSAHNQDSFEDGVQKLGKSFKKDRPMAFLFIEPEDSATPSNIKSGFKALSKFVDKQHSPRIIFNSHLTVNDIDGKTSLSLKNDTSRLESLSGQKGHKLLEAVDSIYEQFSKLSLKSDYSSNAINLVKQILKMFNYTSKSTENLDQEIIGYEAQLDQSQNLFTPEKTSSIPSPILDPIELEKLNSQPKQKPVIDRTDIKKDKITIEDLERDKFSIWFDEIDWDKAIKKSTGSPNEKALLVMMKALAEGDSVKKAGQVAALAANSFKAKKKRKKADEVKARKSASVLTNIKWFKTHPNSFFTKVPGGIDAVKIAR